MKKSKKELVKKIFKSFSIIVIFMALFWSRGFTLGEVFLYENISGYKLNSGKKLEIYNEDYKEFEVIGKNEISFYDAKNNTPSSQKIDFTKLNDLATLKKNFYIVDKKTKKNGDFPKVLIFHTHSHEMFKDSNPNNLFEGIVGAGERLKQRLEEKGIKCIHNTDRFDVVNGKTQITGAYERMEPTIRKILSDNPSIEVVIDMHRDGIDESKKLVKNINGKPTAQVMFFNGLCHILQDGKLTETEGLTNAYLHTNLAFSFALQSKSKELFPNFSRGIYLNAYRYSLHLSPKSTLIEVGAQNNTKEEIFNAIDLLAEVISEVCD